MATRSRREAAGEIRRSAPAEGERHFMRMGGVGPVLVGAVSTRVFFCRMAERVLVLLERGNVLAVKKK